MKANIAIHRDPSGKLSVLELSDDADTCKGAVADCSKPGNAAWFRLRGGDKRKKISGIAAPKKAAPKKAAKAK